MHWLKNNWFIFIGAILLCVYLAVDKPQTDQTIQSEEIIPMEEIPLASTVEPAETEAIHVIKVDVKGEIKKPGIYEMQAESRVDDLIKKAGGLTEKADDTQINLAQKLVDEMSIYVPAQGKEITSVVTDSSSPSTTSKTADTKVHINSATLEEIMTLNGIGATKAEAILSYREENGPFSALEDLLEVSGIGEKTLESLSESIQIP